MKRKMFINHIDNMRSGTAEYPEASKERYSIVSRRSKIPIQMEVGNNASQSYKEEE